jgi:hypothetical protein
LVDDKLDYPFYDLFPFDPYPNYPFPSVFNPDGSTTKRTTQSVSPSRNALTATRYARVYPPPTSNIVDP